MSTTEVVVVSTEVDTLTSTETVTLSTETDVVPATITVTGAAAVLAVAPRGDGLTFPTYASACSSFAKYSSACITCLSVTPVTYTAAAPSTTVTVTISTTSTLPASNITETVTESVTATTSTTTTKTSKTTITTSTTDVQSLFVTATTLVTSTSTAVVTSTSPAAAQDTGFCLKLISTNAALSSRVVTQQASGGTFYVQDKDTTTYTIVKYALNATTGYLNSITYPGYIMAASLSTLKYTNLYGKPETTVLAEPNYFSPVVCSLATTTTTTSGSPYIRCSASWGATNWSQFQDRSAYDLLYITTSDFVDANYDPVDLGIFYGDDCAAATSG